MVTSEQTRQVYWPDERAWVPTAVHDGRTLAAGDTLVGPAVVELPHTTVALTASHRLTVDGAGNLIVALG
jgi:N-methylhydantoinase A